MNKENSKTNETKIIVLNLLQRLFLKYSNKHVALKNLSIYYTWKHVKKQNKNNKLNVLAKTLDDEFE